MARPRALWPLACFAAMGIFWGTWAALLPELRAQVDASDGELGLAMVGIGAGALPAMIVTGRLWRRLGWWLLPATALAFGVAALGPIVAHTPLVLGLALLLVGASSGALDVAMNSAVSDVEVARDRRLMYGAHALFSLAVLVASVLTGLAREAGFGPAAALSVVAVAFAIVAIGSFTAARPIERGRFPVTAAEGRARPVGRAILILAVLCALAFMIEDALQNWSALLLEREMDASPVVGGAGPGVFAGAMFIGRTCGQWLGGRFSDRALLTVGAATAALGLIVAASAGNAPVALGGLAAAGAGVALVAPALFARAGRLADERGRGAAIASLTTFGYMGFVVGPLVVGLLSQAAGLRYAIGALGLVAVALAIGGALALGRRPRRGTFAEGEELLRTSRG